MLSAWPGKTIIGLTGNIATGKSVVRRMLEHLGAFGIDADSLAHRTFLKGAPGYYPILAAFGDDLIGQDGEIDRARLGQKVFGHPESLIHLESILHPLVRQAIDALVRRSPFDVVVIEAIKLIESRLHIQCDRLWVTRASPDVQSGRLQTRRGMSPGLASRRIQVQPAQEEKDRQADVLIRNDGNFASLWQQVLAAWGSLLPGREAELSLKIASPDGEYLLWRGMPQEADRIAALIRQCDQTTRAIGAEQILENLTQQAIYILERQGSVSGIAFWKGENLTGLTGGICMVDKSATGLAALLAGLEQEAVRCQCEAALVFPPPGAVEILVNIGYQQVLVEALNYKPWREAAVAWQLAQPDVFLKALPHSALLPVSHSSMTP